MVCKWKPGDTELHSLTDWSLYLTNEKAWEDRKEKAKRNVDLSA